jgi:hypothetical protein
LGNLPAKSVYGNTLTCTDLSLPAS